MNTTQKETVDQASVSFSSPSSSSSACPSSSPTMVPACPPLTRGCVVLPSSPAPVPPPATRGGAVPIPKGPLAENDASPVNVEDAGDQCRPQDALLGAMPTDRSEIGACLIAFSERHPSVKPMVHRLFRFLVLESAYSKSGKQSRKIAAKLKKAHVRVKLPPRTPPLAPNITPKPALEFPLEHVHTPSGLRREWDLKPLEGEEAKKSARRGRRLFDKKWHGSYSETSPRILTPLEAQAAELVKAYFRAAPRVDAPSVAATSSSSALASPSSAAGPSSLSVSPPVEEPGPTNLVPLESTEEVLDVLEPEVEPLPMGLNLALSPVAEEEEPPSPSPCFNAWSADAMARAMSDAEATLPAPPPLEYPISPPTLDPSQGEEASIEHVEDITVAALDDAAPMSPQPPTATTVTAQSEDLKPHTSFRSRAIACLITGTSARMEAKAMIRRTAAIGLGIVGIGLGLATTSMPSSDPSSMSVELASSSPEVPTAATFEAVPVAMGLNLATTVGHAQSGVKNITHADVIHRQTPCSSFSRNLSSSDAFLPSVDLDAVGEAQAHHSKELPIHGSLDTDINERHSTEHGKGLRLSALLYSMARSLLGSWLRV